MHGAGTRHDHVHCYNCRYSIVQFELSHMWQLMLGTACVSCFTDVNALQKEISVTEPLPASQRPIFRPATIMQVMKADGRCESQPSRAIRHAVAVMQIIVRAMAAQC